MEREVDLEFGNLGSLLEFSLTKPHFHHLQNEELCF